MYNFISKSEKDTINFAKGLASKLHKGDIIVLTGELGSGKTKFTQGFLEYFGLENKISSPTFTIVNEYNSNTGLNIYHFDVYRLSDTVPGRRTGNAPDVLQSEYRKNNRRRGGQISSHLFFYRDTGSEQWRKPEKFLLPTIARSNG